MGEIEEAGKGSVSSFELREERRGRKRTSSGGYSEATLCNTFSFANSVTVPSSRVAPFSARMSLPRLLVRMMVEFLKSITRPCESVSLPSSRTWRRMLATSGKKEEKVSFRSFAGITTTADREMADRVAEERVGERKVIKEGEKGGERTVMRLFELIEENDVIRLPTNRFRQLASLKMADIAWWRADETRDIVLGLVSEGGRGKERKEERKDKNDDVLGHVNGDQVLLGTGELRRKSLSELRLTYSPSSNFISFTSSKRKERGKKRTRSRRTKEQKARHRPVPAVQSRPRETNGGSDGGDGGVLTLDAGREDGFEVEETVGVAAHEGLGGDTSGL